GSGGTITALTSDVSASGSGSVAATVNSVGGSTAANIHNAELAANAATNANTASTIVKRDASGNFTAGTITASLTGAASLNVLKSGDTMTGDLTHGSGKGDIYTDSGTNTVTLKAPTTVSTSYVLRLPTSVAGSNGQVLTSDTLGNLTWTTPSTTATSYSGVLPVANGGTNSSTALNNNRIMVSSGGAIVESAALTNGQLLVGSTGAAPTAATLTAGAGINITNAAGSITIATTGLMSTALADGKIWVGNAGTAAAQTPSGDVTMTNTGAFTVSGIKGVSAVITSLTSGQLLKYNGTNWVNVALSSADLSDSGSLIKSSQMPANCAAGQTLTFSSPTGTWSCTNIVVSGSNFANQSANVVLAGPSSGVAAAPTFRALVAADLPSGTLSGAGTANYVPYYSSATTLANSPMYISGSNVGLGTTSPAYQFTLQDTTNSAKQIRMNDSSTDMLVVQSNETGYSGITTINTDVSTKKWGFGTLANSTFYGPSKGFVIRDVSAGQSRLVIDGSGNVGISTTSPAGKLSIQDTGTPGIQMKNASAGAIDTFNIINDSYNTGSLWIAKGTTANAAPAAADGIINITNEGNVEIYGQAVTSANDKSGVLSLKTQSSATGGTRNEVSMEFYADRTDLNTATGYIGYESNTAFDLTLQNVKAGNMIFATSNAERARINSTGYLGVGTTSPTALLHVNGAALATAWNTSSDIRLKEHITEIQNPLDKILSLRGVEFDWRKDIEQPTKHEQTHDIGVIAQEVEKQFPEAVTTAKDGFKSVAYAKLVSPIIGAIKALYTRITGIEEQQATQSVQQRQLASVVEQKADKEALEAVKADNAAKDQEIKGLKQENAAIKAYLCSKDPAAPICK
ncbi:MAG: tail fiber domain-containing protein, partial [Bacillota bacterium]